MGIHTSTSRALAHGLLLLAVVGCSGSSSWHRSPEPRDLVTDLADDGSLMRGLSHPDPSVRRLAARALGRLPAGDNVGHMLSAASTEVDADTLAEICFTLGQWQATEAQTFLVQNLGHSAPAVRAAAILALGKLQDDTQTDLAVEALADPSAEVRQAAALALFRMDGRRYDHPRHADEEQLTARDKALARAALRDPDEGVRWRATYALANLRDRAGLATILGRCARDERSALCRVFALRGLGELGADGPSGALAEARRRLDDEDARVVLEAARILARDGDIPEVLDLTRSASTNVRMIAVDQLRLRALAERDRAIQTEGQDIWLVPLVNTCEGLLENDPSPAVRREVRALLVAVAAQNAVEPDANVKLEAKVSWTGEVLSEAPTDRLQVAGQAARRKLSLSDDPRDRERLARLIVDGELEDHLLLDQLLADPVPSVVATALGALASTDVATLYHDRDQLEAALANPDPAIRGSAAELVAPMVSGGTAPPWLVTAVADSIDEITTMDTAQRLEMEEARANLASALGLPRLDAVPPADAPHAPLLDRLLEERAQARLDAAPEVVIETSRGEVRVVLDRLAAPRHVESFLELADDGFYDGLDIHRVVPNFVVQGLDPRHDGWGVGGRRVPDEFGPDAYLTGSLGMPHAGSPQSGGCQIFITHVPTPHLDGAYTWFGQVVDGMDVVAALEIGDVIESVRRAPSGNGARVSWIRDS